MVEPSEPHLVNPSPRAPASMAICPFLLAADGQWRSSSPAREHRCTAVEPPAILALEKQRRLCLTAAHTGCATYLAATSHASREAGSELPMPRATRSSGRAFVRTAPLVLDHGRLPVSVSSVTAERGLGQVALLALLAIAFAAILIARLSSGDGDRGVIVTSSATPRPSVVASRSPSAAPSSSAAPSPSAAGSAFPSPSQPSASATPDQTDTPASSAPATYTIRSGDTLSGIAATFGTTVDALTRLNDITDASTLRIGQVLKLR
ncbi:MAG: LysM domain-containing protein [Candidatus Limnocylindrales bacterium]